MNLNTFESAWSSRIDAFEVELHLSSVDDAEDLPRDLLLCEQMEAPSCSARCALVPLTIDDFHDLYEKLFRGMLETMRQWHEIYPDSSAVLRAEKQLLALLAHRDSLSAPQKEMQAHVRRSMDDIPSWVSKSPEMRGAVPLFQPSSRTWRHASSCEARAIIESLNMGEESDASSIITARWQE